MVDSKPNPYSPPGDRNQLPYALMDEARRAADSRLGRLFFVLNTAVALGLYFSLSIGITVASTDPEAIAVFLILMSLVAAYAALESVAYVGRRIWAHRLLATTNIAAAVCLLFPGLAYLREAAALGRQPSMSGIASYCGIAIPIAAYLLGSGWHQIACCGKKRREAERAGSR